MKKKEVFFVLLAISLFLLPDALSINEDLIYSGTVEDGDTIEVEGKEFEFKIDSASNKAYVEIDVSGLIIESGECEVKDNIEVCINNIEFSYRNYTAWYDVYKMEVDIYQVKAKLDITTSIEKSNILIDEETTAEMSIENTADIFAEDVRATLKVPLHLLVSDVVGCKQNFNSISFEDDVAPGSTRKCTFKVTGLSAGDFDLQAEGNYFDGLEELNITSSATTGKVYNYSLDIRYLLNKSKFDIAERINLTIEVENINDEYDIEVTALSIKIPEKLLILERPKDTSGTSLLSWNGALEPKEKKIFEMKLQSLVAKNYLVVTTGSYKINKFLRRTEKGSEIYFYCDCPYIEHDFSQKIVVPEQRLTLTASLINPSLINSFGNVEVSYITNIPGIEGGPKVYSRINPGEKIEILDSPIITPSLGEVYYFNITSKYESLASQVFTAKDNIIIKVPGDEEIEVEEGQREVSIEIQEDQQEISIEEEGTESEDRIMPVTTLLDEEKIPIAAYLVIAIILALVFVFVIIRVKRRKNIENPPEHFE